MHDFMIYFKIADADMLSGKKPYDNNHYACGDIVTTDSTDKEIIKLLEFLANSIKNNPNIPQNYITEVNYTKKELQVYEVSSTDNKKLPLLLFYDFNTLKHPEDTHKNNSIYANLKAYDLTGKIIK